MRGSDRRADDDELWRALVLVVVGLEVPDDDEDTSLSKDGGIDAGLGRWM